MIEIKKYPKKRKLPLNRWTLQYRQINGKQQLVYVMPYRKYGKIHYKYRKAEKNAKIPYQQAKYGDEFGIYDDGSMIHENEKLDFEKDGPENIMYVDVETTGLEKDAQISVIGVSNGKKTEQFSNKDLDKFPNAIKDADALVGFNVKRLDIPMIEAQYGKEILEGKEIRDLRKEAKQKGISGTQPEIEKKLKISRNSEEINGFQKANLSKKAINGDKEALKRIKAHNKTDVENLVRIERKLKTIEEKK